MLKRIYIVWEVHVLTFSKPSNTLTTKLKNDDDSKSKPLADNVILPEESIMNILSAFPEMISKERIPTVSTSVTSMSIISVPRRCKCNVEAIWIENEIYARLILV